MEQDFLHDEPIRRMPSSPEAEAALLGAFMLNPEAWGNVPDLVPGAFFVPAYSSIFAVMKELAAAGKSLDPVSVFAELQCSGSAITLPEINDLAQYVPGRASVRRYADVVQDCYRLRELIDVGSSIAGAAMETGAVAAKEIDKAQMALAKLANIGAKRDPLRIDISMTSYMQLLQELSEGSNQALATGIREFDKLLNGGLRRGELLVLGARPKHGKTALALAISRHLAAQYRVLFLSQEMPINQLMHRHTAAAASIDLSRILAADRSDSDMWASVSDASRYLAGLNLYHDDQTSLTLGDIRRKAIKVKREAGLDVLFVDFLQRMASSEKDNRSRDLDLIVNGIKDLAMDLDIAAVVLSQMNRGADEQYARPMMTHLRESGAIEAAADQIALLFTDWAHPMSKRLPEFKGFSELEIVAHRNGPQGVVPLQFLGQYQQVRDWYGEVPVRLGSHARGGGIPP